MTLVHTGWLQFNWAKNSKVLQQPSESRSRVSHVQHPPRRPGVIHADDFHVTPLTVTPPSPTFMLTSTFERLCIFFFWYLFWDLVCVLVVETRSVWPQIHFTCFSSRTQRSQSTVMGRCGGSEQLPHSQSGSRKGLLHSLSFLLLFPSSPSGYPTHGDATTHIQRGSFSIIR